MSDKPKGIDTKIDLRIEEVERQISRPGWSIWAILATFGAVFFLLLGVIKDFTGSYLDAFTITIPVYLVMSFAVSFATTTPYVFHRSERTYIRFFSEKWLGSKRILVLELLTNGLLVFGYSQLRVELWLQVYAQTFFGLITLLMALSLVLAHTNLPTLSTNPKRRPLAEAITTITVYGSYLLVIVFTLLPYILSFMSWISEFQFSVVLASLILLIQLLVKESRPIPLLRQLRQLRSDHVLGLIGEKEASERFDLIVFGLGLRQYLTEDLDRLLGVLHNLSEAQSSFDKYIELTDSDLGTISETKKWAIRETAIVAANGQLDRMKQLLDEYEKASHTLSSKMYTLKANSQTLLDYQEIEGEIESRKIAIVENLRSISTKLKLHLVMKSDTQEHADD